MKQNFRRLADYRVVRADFIQTRRLAELDMTIEIRGEMVCETNGRLRWQVNSPVRSITVIGKKSLTHFDAETGKTAQIAQSRFPWLKVLRDCLSDWISGDPERLTKRFDLAGKDERTLRLTPKEAGLKNLFRSIEIRADAKFAAVEAITIEENSGDVLTIRFVNVRKDPVDVTEKTWRAAPE